MERMKNYEDYLNAHILCVQRVWKTVENLFKNEDWLDDHWRYVIGQLIKKHDASKSSEEEFEGYKQFFFTEPGKKKNKERFEYAWNHHIKANPHHWEYWVKMDGTPLDMPFKYIIELLCDWTAMSIYHDNNMLEWYEAHKNKMILDPRTKRVIDRYIKYFDGLILAKEIIASTLIPSWDCTAIYELGDKVYFDGNLYKKQKRKVMSHGISEEIEGFFKVEDKEEEL